MVLKAQALRPGDTVAIVAPSGPFDAAAYAAGRERLAARYTLQEGRHLRAQRRYLAGSDAERLSDLLEALRGDAVRAIFCARGGYGAMRLLRSLAPHLTGPAKPLVGFSDITALHALWQRSGLASIHAPVVTQLGRLAGDEAQRLFALLEQARPAEALQGEQCLVPGTAEGPLVGGNLSVLTRLLGTPFLPPLEGAVLLLEDVAERPYRLDRMWTHLELAGVFARIAGIALGSFTGCDAPDGGGTAPEVLAGLAAATGLPCASGFPVGHGTANQPLALGCRVRLEAERCRLIPLEAAVGPRTD